MKFKADSEFLFVEGIQFINGLYETTDKKEIEILKRYTDRVTVVEEEKTSKATKATDKTE